jgi:hypothetical protein
MWKQSFHDAFFFAGGRRQSNRESLQRAVQATEQLLPKAISIELTGSLSSPSPCPNFSSLDLFLAAESVPKRK